MILYVVASRHSEVAAGLVKLRHQRNAKAVAFLKDICAKIADVFSPEVCPSMC